MGGVGVVGRRASAAGAGRGPGDGMRTPLVGPPVGEGTPERRVPLTEGGGAETRAAGSGSLFLPCFIAAS